MSAEIVYLVLICICYLALFFGALCGAETLLVLVPIITITGNVIVGKILTVSNLQLASSACLAVCLFWIGSLLTQYYGIRAARRALWYNFASLIFLTVIGYLAMAIPGNVNPEMDSAIGTLFTFMPSVMIGAMCSFGASYLFTIFVQRRFQKKHDNQVPWYVATGIVAAANLIDVTIFCLIAYFGQKVNFIELIGATWGIRLIALVLGLPVILLIRKTYKSAKFPILKSGLV